MFRRFAAVLFALMLALPAHAQEEPIQNTISRQIDAFLVDDFPKAFTFASPSIQGIFRTPENFGRMVSQGYPMVWRPADVQYLDLREEGGVLIQKVLITDQEGGQHVLDYRMIETGEGWKINGVSLLDSSAVAA
ncbi:MAG: DUF4864 domain-containing protein [Pseudomonadota bacterium]